MTVQTNPAHAPSDRSVRSPAVTAVVSQWIRRLLCAAVVCTSSLRPAAADPILEAPDRILPGDSLAADLDREAIRGPLDGLIVVPRRSSAVKDPRDRAEFSSSVHVYLSDNGALVRRFIVHAPDRDGAPLARRCGRMLAWLWTAAHARFGSTARGLFGAPVHAWMTRSGEAGGEQFRNNLYFYRLFEPRTGLEWAREIAHEYGHYLLPAPSGYTDPESWANGVLGERLFLKWILDDLQAGVTSADALPFATRAELEEYRSRQIAPLLARMRVDGPDAASLAKTDRDAFDNYTALLLYADDTYGGRILTDLLDYLPPSGKRALRGDDFLRALMLRLDACETIELRLPPGEASLVYVPRGSFHVTAAGGSLVFGKGLTASRDESGWRLTAAAAGWRLVRASAGAGPIVVRLARLGSSGAGSVGP